MNGGYKNGYQIYQRPMKLNLKKKKSPDLIGGVSVSHSRYPAVPRPAFTDRLKFPEEITELGSANVSDLLGKYTLLWSYVNQDAARLKVTLLRLQHQESRRTNDMFRENPRLSHVEKWRRDAVVSEDSYIEAVRQQISRAEAELEYANMYLANYDRYINALSRELTRKMSEYQRAPRAETP